MRDNEDMRRQPRHGAGQETKERNDEWFNKNDLPYFIIEEIIKIK